MWVACVCFERHLYCSLASDVSPSPPSLACTCIIQASQHNKQMNTSDSVRPVQAVEALDQVRQQVQERIAEQGLLAQRPGRRVQKQKAKHSQTLRLGHSSQINRVQPAAAELAPVQSHLSTHCKGHYPSFNNTLLLEIAACVGSAGDGLLE